MFPLKDENPTSTAPIITGSLIAINVLVFLYQLSLGPKYSQLFVFQYGSIPAVVTGEQQLPAGLVSIPPMMSIFTSLFIHGGWMHLIGNMWFLWIFGNNIEEAMGKARYLLFYLVCGFIASWSHILSDLSSVIPTIGASGAIGGVLGAYLMLYPRARVWTLIFLGIFSRLMYIPAWVILGYWFLIQLVSGSMTQGRGGGVAFWAHVGGFLAGVILVGLFKRRDVKFFNPPYRSLRFYEGD
jgi:membrane associated rhomboid family serine protease